MCERRPAITRDKELSRLTIKETLAGLARGDFSVVELVEHYLKRIEAWDKEIRAWALVDGQGARQRAQQLDADLRRGRLRGPLHGIPVGVKDLFYTAGLRTEAGSPLWAGFVPDEDARAVARLKEAGAIILGKTQTTPLGFFDPSPTLNPWNTAHTPGGSSSGSGAAVAAGMCPVALGTQVGGSVLRPAAYNGVVGFKPQLGRISTWGSLQSNWTLAHVGVITRTVEDAALVFPALAGYDPRDPFSLDEPVPDSLTHLESRRKPRLGLVRRPFFDDAEEEMRRHTEEVARRLHEAGAAIEEVTLPASFASIQEIHPIIVCVEAAASHREGFARHREKYSPKISEMIEKGLTVPATDYAKALYSRRQQCADIRPLLNRFDALLTPAAPGAAPRDLTTTGNPVMQIPWSVVGVPALSLPTGLSQHGLPLGIQLVGPARDEPHLLRVGRWCEKVLNVSLEPPLA